LAAKILDIPRSYVSHSHLLAAYYNLQQPEYLPNITLLPSSVLSPLPDFAAAAGTRPGAGALLEVDGPANGAPSRAGAQIMRAASALDSVRNAVPQGAGKKKKKGQSRQEAAAASAAAPAGAASLATSAVARSSLSDEQLLRARLCAQKAAQGVAALLPWVSGRTDISIATHSTF
jgi:hypothetical protein